jgi:hypothetical protein
VIAFVRIASGIVALVTRERIMIVLLLLGVKLLLEVLGDTGFTKTLGPSIFVVLPQLVPSLSSQSV